MIKSAHNQLNARPIPPVSHPPRWSAQRRWAVHTRPGQRFWTPYLYILPALLVYGYFILLPMAQGLRLSLYEWNGYSPKTYIGLDNYQALRDDDDFHMAFVNNLKFIIFFSALPIGLALLLTALMTRRQLPGMNGFRAGLFMPYIISSVVVGIAWRWLYHPNMGPLNETLRAVGLASWARPWLGDFTWALPAVGIVVVWAQYGFCLVLFIAGVQRIEEVLYDAAKVDGANAFQQFWHVTLPGIRNEVTVAAVTTIISALRIFDLIYVLTSGGPAKRTTVTSFLLIRHAFRFNKIGYASAIAVVQAVVIFIVSYVIIRLRADRAASEASYR